MSLSIEQQVVSLDLARKLKELGYKQEGLFCYAKSPIGEVIVPMYRTRGVVCAAPTATEIWDIIPQNFRNVVTHVGNSISAHAISLRSILFKGDTEADVRAQLLVHLVEQGHVSFTK